MKWWTFSQNNSGGYFIENDVVDQYVLVQAPSFKVANLIFNDLVSGYTEYCECCGERWDYSPYNDEGDDEPEIYGESVYDFVGSSTRTSCILHYIDGKIEKVKFNGK